MAYADAQHDPRTGEVLNAQIWLSSVFAVSGRAKAKRLLKTLQSFQAPALPASGRVGIKGFEKEPLCSYEFTSRGFEGLVNLVELDDDKKIHEVSSDYVRLVVAHEVGHVLGLRHNFAGSLGISYTREERQRYFKDYLKDLKVPSGVVPGSSVMDYSAYEESVFMGNNMRAGQEKLLDYDHMAIHHLYVNGGEKGEAEETPVASSTEESTKRLGPDFNEYNRPLFCTDSHRSRFVDCDIFDVFGSPVDEAIRSFHDQVRNLPVRILERFVEAKDPAKGDIPRPLAKAFLSPTVEAMYLFDGQRKVLRMLTEQGAMLQVVRSFEQVNELNKERVDQVTNELIYREVQKNGGLEKVFVFLSEDFVEEQMLRFSQILEKSYRKGVGPGGKGYEFDEDEVKFMTTQAKTFYTLLKEEAHKLYLKLFVKIRQMRDTQLSMDLAKFFLEKSRYYLMDITSSVVSGSVKKEKVHLLVDAPEFTNKFEIRKLSTKLLSSDRGGGMFWAKKEKKQLKKEYQNFLDQIFQGKKFEDLKEEDMSQDLLFWYWEQQILLDSL